jgi:hypothetical protein
MSRSPCPCCSCLTLEDPPPGTFAICPVCFWEDDDVQFRDPDYAGGANAVSLREARANFLEFGASDQALRGQVREPLPHEKPPSA